MEKETLKLVNVLRRIARAAGYAAWTKSGSDATQFLVAQYNRVLARLSELEPAVKPLFTTLNESASPEVIRIASRDLLAYFEADEPEFVKGFYYCGPRRRRRPKVKWMPFFVNCK